MSAIFNFIYRILFTLNHNVYFSVTVRLVDLESQLGHNITGSPNRKDMWLRLAQQSAVSWR